MYGELVTQALFNNILFATDFSSSSTAALPHAVAIARHFGAKLYLAYVIPTDAYDLIPAAERDAALGNMRRHVEQQMTGLRGTALLRGIQHSVLVDHGNVWPRVSMMVEKQKIDLIVIGTHGRSGVEKLLMGSIAEEILRCARAPILMVGPDNLVPRKKRPIHDAFCMPPISLRNPKRRCTTRARWPVNITPRCSSCMSPRTSGKNRFQPGCRLRIFFGCASWKKTGRWRKESNLSTTLSLGVLPSWYWKSREDYTLN